MPFFEVTKTVSEIIYVEAADQGDALTKARQAEDSWERYKWSEPDLDYDVLEVRAGHVAAAVENGELVR